MKYQKFNLSYEYIYTYFDTMVLMNYYLDPNIAPTYLDSTSIMVRHFWIHFFYLLSMEDSSSSTQKM